MRERSPAVQLRIVSRADVSASLHRRCMCALLSWRMVLCYHVAFAVCSRVGPRGSRGVRGLSRVLPMAEQVLDPAQDQAGGEAGLDEETDAYWRQKQEEAEQKRLKVAEEDPDCAFLMQVLVQAENQARDDDGDDDATQASSDHDEQRHFGNLADLAQADPISSPAEVQEDVEAAKSGVEGCTTKVPAIPMMPAKSKAVAAHRQSVDPRNAAATPVAAPQRQMVASHQAAAPRRQTVAPQVLAPITPPPPPTPPPHRLGTPPPPPPPPPPKVAQLAAQQPAGVAGVAAEAVQQHARVPQQPKAPPPQHLIKGKGQGKQPKTGLVGKDGTDLRGLGNQARYEAFGTDHGKGCMGKTYVHPDIQGERRRGDGYFRPSGRYGKRSGRNWGWNSVNHELRDKNRIAQKLFHRAYPIANKPHAELNNEDVVHNLIDRFVWEANEL